MPDISERGSAVGAGGWSVNRAEDAEGRPVRVCAMPMPHDLSAAGRERIAATLNAAVAASAHGRLSLLSWSEHEGTLYTVEPAPATPSVGEAVAANGPLSPSDLIPLLHGIMAAQSAMAAAGLHHAWLAPENVYPGATLQLAGQAWPAVFVILSAESGSFSWPGPDYAAPEVRNGSTPDGAAEAWSAAALITFALTGRAPSVGRIGPEMSAVANAVARAMSQDPATRYRDLKSMVVDLTVEQAIGLADIADEQAVPSGGDVPDWGRDLLRETSARRDTGRPLVDTVPEPPKPAPKRAEPIPAPVPAPSPASPTGKGRKSPERGYESAEPTFNWDAGAPRKSMMPVIVSIITALFIIAGLALTFLRK